MNRGNILVVKVNKYAITEFQFQTSATPDGNYVFILKAEPVVFGYCRNFVERMSCTVLKNHTDGRCFSS